MEFRPIWPLAPTFTREGGAIIRFSVRAEYRNVYAILENMRTRKVTKQTENCQTLSDGRVETFMRITFPENGKYKVKLSMATPDGNWFHASERAHTDMIWRFDVSGAPGAARPISRLMRETRFMRLVYPDTLRISRDSSCIRIRGLVYEFTCAFRGKLKIKGRERIGEPQQKFDLVKWDNITFCEDGHRKWINIHQVFSAGEWNYRLCRLKYPCSGTWRAMFWIDGELVATQTVVTGFEDSLQLTGEEERALAAASTNTQASSRYPALF